MFIFVCFLLVFLVLIEWIFLNVCSPAPHIWVTLSAQVFLCHQLFNFAISESFLSIKFCNAFILYIMILITPCFVYN